METSFITIGASNNKSAIIFICICVTVILFLPILTFLSSPFFLFLCTRVMYDSDMSTQDLPHLKPAVSTVLRAYGLGWILTTAPGLIAVLVKAVTAKKQRSSAIQKAILLTVPKLLKRSIVNNGLPLLLAASVGGQRFLRYVCQKYAHKQLSLKGAIFWSSFLSILSVRKLYPNIKTLEVTFFVLVRAFDVFAHRLYGSVKVRQRVPEWMLEYGNIFIFMLASTEIIFSWFYEPQRLPK